MSQDIPDSLWGSAVAPVRNLGCLKDSAQGVYCVLVLVDVGNENMLAHNSHAAMVGRCRDTLGHLSIGTATEWVVLGVAGLKASLNLPDLTALPRKARSAGVGSVGIEPTTRGLRVRGPGRDSVPLPCLRPEGRGVSTCPDARPSGRFDSCNVGACPGANSNRDSRQMEDQRAATVPGLLTNPCPIRAFSSSVSKQRRTGTPVFTGIPVHLVAGTGFEPVTSGL